MPTARRKPSASRTSKTQAEARRHRAQVSAYIAARPAGARRPLRLLRDSIRAGAPGVTDSFGYGIPGFRLDGRVFLYYAAWKQHTSVYPLTSAMLRSHAAEIRGYETSKGTIRFPLDRPLPVAFVKRLARTRLAEMRATGRTSRKTS